MHTFNDIYDNLDVNNKQINNKTLLPNILDGNIPYHILAFMKMYQIHPDRWNYIINKNNLRDTTLQNVILCKLDQLMNLQLYFIHVLFVKKLSLKVCKCYSKNLIF